MSAPRIVGRNYTEATKFALETLGLAPRTYRVTTTVGGLAGYGYTLHLAPGWSKAPYAHALRNKIKFKRNIEVIDHEASVQKEQARQIENAPEPPEGWFVFGTHVADDPVPALEFSDEVGRDDLPLWERPLKSETQNDAATNEGMPPVAPEEEPTTVATDETPEETDDPTGAPEPSENAEGAEDQPKRRRRRCKTCGVLVEPDDVEAHAAQHEAE